MKTFHISNVLEAGLDEAGRGPLFGRVYVCLLYTSDAADE